MRKRYMIQDPPVQYHLGLRLLTEHKLGSQLITNSHNHLFSVAIFISSSFERSIENLTGQ